jgi:feruloyl esterase
VTSLLCEREGLQGCLTDARLKAAQSIYGGPKDQHGDLFYGFPFGGESDDEGWSRWLTGGLALYKKPLSDGRLPPKIPNMHYGFGNGVMKYFVYQDANWDYSTYDFSTFREDSMAVGATLNATDPDLSAFRDRGGKLLMYQGWSDTAISALGTIGYYEEVLAQDKTAKSYARLFMMPGVLHCAGGKGPSSANFLNELDQWVESGEAPEQVTAYFLGEDRKPTGSRPLCPYPQRAEYDGHGSPRKIESFSCSEGE